MVTVTFVWYVCECKSCSCIHFHSHSYEGVIFWVCNIWLWRCCVVAVDASSAFTHPQNVFLWEYWMLKSKSNIFWEWKPESIDIEFEKNKRKWTDNPFYAAFLVKVASYLKVKSKSKSKNKNSSFTKSCSQLKWCLQQQ